MFTVPRVSTRSASLVTGGTWALSSGAFWIGGPAAVLAVHTPVPIVRHSTGASGSTATCTFDSVITAY